MLRASRLAGPGPRELLFFGLVYLLYDASRWVFHGHLRPAREHAYWVLHLEHGAHLAVERSVQHAFGGPAASFVLSHVYLAAQLVVLPGALIWTYRRSRPIYRKLRNSVIGAWAIAVPIFAAFPVAPPRLAGIGLDDTVSRYASVSLTGHSTMFFNPYAAVPSLHVGLAFAIGTAMAAVTRARWAKAFALLWGPLITLSVLATGNHYLFDAGAGLLATGLAYAASELIAHRSRIRRTARTPRTPILRPAGSGL